MPNIAFINGKWTSLSSAKISIEDRGFQFGDGVYEVIRTYGKACFELKEHLTRLERSANAIEIALPYQAEILEKIIQFGCRKSRFKDTMIYIQLTRGTAPRGHAYPKKKRSTLVMTFRESKPVSEEIRKKGVSIISTEDIRWARCYVKSLNLLPNVLAREAAKRAEAFEAIFIREGHVMEGAGSNLFAVFGDKIVTPSLGPYILSGITREIILRLGRENGLTMVEGSLPLDDLYVADELFLTGTTIEVLPVICLNQKPVGSTKPGDVTLSLFNIFQDYVS